MNLLKNNETAESLRERALRRTPGGVNSNVRLDAPQVFFAAAEGAWLHDVGGRDYVDYLLGQGPAFFGHARKEIVDAVCEACRHGMLFGAQHPLEVEAAERICGALGWADMVRVGTTGTETAQAAIRLARASTGRRRLVRFEGQYHGWLDNVLIRFEPGPARPASAGQLPEALESSIVLPWNDLDVVRETLERETDIAAVITEPVMLNQGAIEPRAGYLQGLKDLCRDAGVVLIFDEVITGFRLALGGAAELYGVTPDLAIYGKALGGGFPVAALAGRGELMERFGTGEVNHSGTFNSSVMASAAVVASIDLLRRINPYQRLASYGRELMGGLRELAQEAGLPLRVEGPGIAFHASFVPEGEDPRSMDITDLRVLQKLDAARYSELARHLAQNGIWVAGRGIWYVSTAHGDPEMNETLARANEAFRAFAQKS